MWYKPKESSLLESSHLIGLHKTALYLIYENKPQGLWWQRFLKTGYKHVFAVRYDGFFWIKTELTIGFMDSEVLPYYDHATIDVVLKDRVCSYQYVKAYRKMRYRSLFGISSCTEGMKMMLGIRAWWVITPWQLHEYCRKRLNANSSKT